MTPRLKQLRLACGFSLDDLANAMGGIVTRQAIHLYEQGKASPSAGVLNQLAKALGVKTIELITPPRYSVSFVAYRRYKGMGKGDSESVEAYLARELERRAELQEQCCRNVSLEVPITHYAVSTVEEAEEAANALRKQWQLGLDPISDLTMVLESHLVHVVEIKSSEKFDGLSAVVRDSEGKSIAIGVASRDDVPGDRQRLSLAHELGHIVMKIADGADEEKLAFRFAGAFLLPKACVFREIGRKRTSLQISELILMKKRFRVSIQAIIRRLYDLEIISQPTYKSAFTAISRMGWRKVEPEPIDRERSEWARQVASRGVSEKLLSVSDAERLTGIDFQDTLSTSLMRKTQFRALPIAERRKILVRESEALAPNFNQIGTNWMRILIMINSINRGQVWSINLDPKIGLAIKKQGVVVVISSDAISKVPFKMIVPVVKWDGEKTKQSWNVKIEPTSKNGLKGVSLIDPFGVRSISTSRFVEALGNLDSNDLEEVVQALAIVIEL